MISEKCVLNLKSGKFHISLSFGFARECNEEKRKPPEAKSTEERRPGRPGWEEGLQNKTEIMIIFIIG